MINDTNYNIIDGIIFSQIHHVRFLSIWSYYDKSNYITDFLKWLVLK